MSEHFDPSDPNWMSPDETPDGKWHHLTVVANTSGQWRVYLDGVDEATWIDQRPSYLDLWRVMARRFGSWRRVRSVFYGLTRAIPPVAERPNYGNSYSHEVLADSPLAYYRLGDHPDHPAIDEVSSP